MNPNYDKERSAKQDPEQLRGYMAMNCAGRQSAKGVLRDKVRHLRMEADRLEALAGALPEKLPQEADEALWHLLLRS